jgi:SAM-dependent methyltransferase
MDARIEALNPKDRFSDRAENYLRYRPHYPKEIIPYLKTEAHLSRSDTIADIGSGTGFLAELFLDNGNLVFGVEPNAEMRAAGDRYLEKAQNFITVKGSAEHTNLPAECIEVVTVGQAFHWFDVNEFRTECQRILRGKKKIVMLIWNIRDEVSTDFSREYEKLIQNYSEKYNEIKDSHGEEKKVRAFFQHRPVHIQSFAYKQSLDFDALKGRYLSSSYIPINERYDQMMIDLRKVFDETQSSGTVDFIYETRVFWGNLV